MGQSYTVFAKLLDEQQQLGGSVERLPADGYSTIYWLENEIVTDSFELPVAADIPPGIYWLNVGLYEEIDHTAVSLPLMTDGQPSEITSVTFGPVKVGDVSPSLVLSPEEGESMVPLVAEFGQPPEIMLRGYDLVQENGELTLTLYWEKMLPTSLDWTTFVHLRDNTGQTVAQKDGLAGGYRYPTSIWNVGEIVVDRTVIPLEDVPKGVYTLYLGFYNFDNGERLPVADNLTREIRLPEVVGVLK
jgi:hypothetical protein